MYKLLRGGLVVGAAFALTAGFSSAASAGTIETIRVAGGSGTFLDYGDRVQCQDDKADGLGLRTTATSMKNGEEWIVYSVCRGKDTYDEDGTDFVEGAKVKLRLCYINSDGVDVRCSKYQYATA